MNTLAQDTRGHAFTSASAAAAGLRKAVASGHESLQGANVKTIRLAPFVVALAFVPLLFLLRRRNLTEV